VLLTPLRWLSRNLSTLLLAFILAIVVWVSAVIEQDPSIQAVYGLPVEIETVGLDSSLLMVRKVPQEVQVTINAPNSRWEQLNNNPELVRAWIDLSELEPGEHTVEIQTQVGIVPAQVVEVLPETVQITLESLASVNFTIQPIVNGDPSQGYQRDELQVEPEEVVVSGPESLVERVKQVRATLEISGANQTIRRTVDLQPLDENGNIVSGVTLTPQEAVLTQIVNLREAYRNVVVKPITTGQVADGYWLTNISVTPPNVTVFSANPSLINSLAPFVETEPLDLSGLNDDTDLRAILRLPEGVSLVGEQSVLVRIGIAALQGSATLTIAPEVVGLPPTLAAQVAPEAVDVILAGPLPILRSLTPAGVRLVVDLSGLEAGIYQVTPVVDLRPAEVQVESILPQSIQVSIGPAPTPTATSSAIVTVLPTFTPGPPATETPAPTP
jgi:YbbR domain-containing protein